MTNYLQPQQESYIKMAVLHCISMGDLCSIVLENFISQH